MKKTLVLCDLDGTDPRPGVAVVEMLVHGVTYEIDVCQEHLDRLSKLPPTGGSPASDAEPRAAEATIRVDASGLADTTVGQGDDAPRPTGGAKSGGVKPGKSRRPAKPRARGAAAGQAADPSGGPSSTGPSATGRRRPGSRRAQQERIARAREWARAQGREVADRGRLPTGLLAEYEAAHA